jgi:O-antigen ligase
MCAAVAAPALISSHTFPLPAFYQEWLAFALGLAALVPLLIHPQIRELRLPRIALAPVVLLVAIITQAALGEVAYVEQALIACVYLLWTVALIWCASLLRQTLGAPRVCEILAVGIAGIAITTSVLVIARHLGIPLPVSLITAQLHERAYGNFTQPNLFADYLALGLASLQLLRARQRLSTREVMLVATPVLIALALSQSRSAWVFIGFMVFISIALRLRNAELAQRHHYVELSAFFLLGLAAAYLLVPMPDRPAAADIAERLFRTAGSIDARFELWAEAWRIFASAPWLGAGLGQFAIERFSATGEYTPYAALGLFTHAHNIVLQLAAEFGAFVTLGIMVLVVSWGRSQWRAPLTMESVWVLVVVGILALHSLLEFPLWYANFLLIAALALGLGEQRNLLSPQAFGVVRLAGLLVIGGVCLATSFAAYRDVERLFTGPSGDAVPSVLVREARALETRSIFLPFIELAYSGLLRIDGHDADEVLQINSRVMQFMPDDHVVYRQTLLLAQAGESRQAQDLLMKSIASYPGFLQKYTAVLESLARERPGVFEPLRETVRIAARR